MMVLLSVLLSLGIAGFGVWQGFLLFGGYRASIEQLDKLGNKLGNCAEGQSFKQELLAWRKASDPTSGMIAKRLLRLLSKEPIRVHNRQGWAIDLDDLCDGKRLFRTHPAYERMQTMPGILTGIGILFTFVGLTLGVYGLDPTNADALTAGVKQLLGGMSMAFLTSVAGVATALWFTWTHKQVMDRFEAATGRLFVTLLEKSFLLLPEEFNDQFFEHQSAQSQVLSELDQTIANGIQSGLDRVGWGELRAALGRLANSGAGEAQSAQVTRALLQEIQGLNTGFRELIGANQGMSNLIKGLSEQQQVAAAVADPSQSARVLADTRKLLEGFSHLQHHQADNGRFTLEAGEEMRKLIVALRTAGGDIAQTHRSLLEQMNRLESHWDTYRGQIEGMRDSLQQSLSGVEVRLRESLTSVHGEIDGLLAQSVGHFGQALKDFEGTLQNFSILLKRDEESTGPVGAKKPGWFGK